jgi:hypothetical protein
MNYEEHIFHSVEVFGKFGPKAAPAVDFLEYYLKKGGPFLTGRVVRQLMESIGAIGPKAKKLLPLVQKYTDAGKLPREIGKMRLSQEEKEAIAKAAQATEKVLSGK